MTLIPIIARELRVHARSRRLRWPRVIMAAATLMVVTWIIFLPEWSGAQIPPQVSLTMTFGLAFLVALFTGARLTADSFSEEYREGTIGLLFLSHLRGWEIAVGKLVSNTVAAGCTLLAAVPMLCIPIMLGGASGGVVLRLAVGLINALIFSAALGLFFSSQSHSGRRAQNLATLILVLMLLGTPFLVSVAFNPRYAPWTQPLLWISPVWTFTAAWGQFFGVRGGGGGPGFWSLFGIQQALAWSLVLLAGFIAARRSVDRPEGKVRLGWRQRLQLWRLGGAATRTKRRRQMLDRNPFEWLVCRYRFRPVWPLVIVSAPLVGFLVLHVAFPREIELLTALGWAVGLMHLLLKFNMAADAPNPLLSERRAGTAELLLSTPLSHHDFLSGQWRAMWGQFSWALGLTLATTAVLACGLLLQANGAGEPESWIAVLLVVVGVALLADFWTLTWVGMWCATWTQHPRRAAGNTAAFVLVAPNVALMLLSFFGGWVLALLAPNGPSSTMTALLPFLPFIAWAILGFGSDLFWTILTRRILRYRLRAVLGKPLRPEDR